MPKKQVNFKLPQDLIEALDAKASRENTNRTELVIQGIRHILGLSKVESNRIDNRIEKRIEKLEAHLHEFETHRIDIGVEIQRVEDDIHTRLHELTKEIQDLSDRLSKSQQKESTKTTEHQTSPETIASGDKSIKLTLTELAKRLGVDRSNLAKVRKSKTVEELADYTKKRDPEGLGWRFDEGEETFRSV